MSIICVCFTGWLWTILLSTWCMNQGAHHDIQSQTTFYFFNRTTTSQG